MNSRPNLDETAVELRGMAPRWIIDVLDAVANARKSSRQEVVVRVLQEWAERRLHESTLVVRCTQGNGRPSGGGRKVE